jgi:hypothetical protein
LVKQVARRRRRAVICHDCLKQPDFRLGAAGQATFGNALKNPVGNSAKLRQGRHER